jgi:hypothetical protein
MLTLRSQRHREVILMLTLRSQRHREVILMLTLRSQRHREVILRSQRHREAILTLTLRSQRHREVMIIMSWVLRLWKWYLELDLLPAVNILLAGCTNRWLAAVRGNILCLSWQSARDIRIYLLEQVMSFCSKDRRIIRTGEFLVVKVGGVYIYHFASKRCFTKFHYEGGAFVN